MTLDEQLEVAQARALNIQSLASKREMIKNLITTFSKSTPTDIMMMSPLNVLNVAMSYEEISAINDVVIAKLAEKLVETEEELALTINQ